MKPKLVKARKLRIPVAPGVQVSALLQMPARPLALFVFAHGAGAAMSHSFMTALAGALSTRGTGSLRFNFPYMERGSKRPDAPPLCHATIRAAVARARKLAPTIPLIAGGKSFGGRMTSQAQAHSALAGVHGLAFVGFPLHPAKRPSTTRAAHLTEIDVPLLFLQGTRDDLADLSLLEPLVKNLRGPATVHRIEGADHGFHVLRRSGRTDPEVLNELADVFAAWASALRKRPARIPSSR